MQGYAGECYAGVTYGGRGYGLTAESAEGAEFFWVWAGARFYRRGAEGAEFFFGLGLVGRRKLGGLCVLGGEMGSGFPRRRE